MRLSRLIHWAAGGQLASLGMVPPGGLVQVCVGWSGSDLLVQVANDGPAADPDTWSPGLGVRSIQRRAVRLGGVAQWTAREEGGVLLMVRIPLKNLSQGDHE